MSSLWFFSWIIIKAFFSITFWDPVANLILWSRILVCELLRPKSCCILAQSADENRAFFTSSSFLWSVKWSNWASRGFSITQCCTLESRCTWDVNQFLYFCSFGTFALYSSVIRTFGKSRETIRANFYMTRSKLWCWSTSLTFFSR